MFGGFGRPGAREYSKADTENLVSVPLMQYAAASIICALLGIGDLAWLCVFFLRAGVVATWVIVSILILAALVGAYLAAQKLFRLKRYLEPALLGIAAFAELTWLTNGRQWVWLQFAHIPEGSGWESFPVLVIVGWLILSAPFHYFALYVCWGWRNDMSDKAGSGWTPTRREIPGDRQPFGPGVNLMPVVSAPEQQAPGLIIQNGGRGEQFIELDVKGRPTRLTLYDCENFLHASEVGNRGLTRELARSCRIKKDTHAALVERLQLMGLATANSQGATAKLTKPYAIVLHELGYNLDGYDDDYDDDDTE